MGLKVKDKFGREKEPVVMRLFSVRLPEDLVKRIKLRAIEEDLPYQELVAKALNEYL